MTHLVLPGSMAYPAAFQEALGKLQMGLGVTRVLLCCDRGMVSEGNLEGLREAGLPYLVATRLRRDKVVAQEVLSQPGRYQVVAENLWVKEVHFPRAEDRHIVCLNPMGAEEDRQNRERSWSTLGTSSGRGTPGGSVSSEGT